MRLVHGRFGFSNPIGSVCAILFSLILSHPVYSTTYHVQKTGNDNTTAGPFLTINKAAQVAQPGDEVTVHEGVYREWVQPARGGSSESDRITYSAASGELVEIKGSERVTTWVSQGNGVWRADLSDSFFGGYNPFSYSLEGKYPGEGSQYITSGQWCHLGEVYLDGQIYREKQSLSEVQSTRQSWYVSRSGSTTSIYANFGSADPNTQLAEVNVREAVFGSSSVTSGIDYVTVDGFHMSQSADAWKPPYTRDISYAVIFPTGDNWIIRNCRIRYGKMRGVCLDGGSENTIVRDNSVTECGIAGVCGSSAHGSIISGNWISDLHGSRPYGGDEHGAVKFNTTTNVTICGNVLRKMIAPTHSRAIMVDYNGDGWRITGNLLIESTDVLIFWLTTRFETCALVDNNVFIGNGPQMPGQVHYAHNTFYCGGGGSSSNNNLVLGNGTLTHTADTVAETISLTLTLSSTVAGQNSPVLTSAALGSCPSQEFPNVSLDSDILSMCRNPTAKPGAFQDIKSGTNTFLFRPNSKFLDNVPCAVPDTNVVSTPGISPAGGYLFSPTPITMTCATADAQICYTLDGSDPTESSTPYSAPFTLSDPATIKARGFKTAKTPSEVGTVEFLAPRTPENPANASAGLRYSYYEGTWSSLPGFDAMTPVETGTTNSFDLSVRNRDDNFGIVFTGYIEVPQNGMYTFTTRSDDGSSLHIGATQVVDNDGAHAAQDATGSIGLMAGKHAIRVAFFEAAGEEVLAVSWQGPGVTPGLIPPDALFAIDGATVSHHVKSTIGFQGLRVLPNSLVAGSVGATVVRIVNARGQVVITERFAGTGLVNLAGLTPGVYQASIVSATGVRSATIVR